MRERREKIRDTYPQLKAEVHGRGFMCGVAVSPASIVREIFTECFNNKLMIELAGWVVSRKRLTR
ncbi:MAG: hypothetical protein JW925_06920 [Syntrophaceae bacterium]|nr:hypothetical protein [Syntrophaceae bacterium]